MSYERKERWAQIRISKEEDEMIKKYGGNKTEIFRIGLNEWSKSLPEKMKEQAEYYKKMSIQCIDNLKEFNVIEKANINLLDKTCLQYIELGRTIPQDLSELPPEDESWIEARIKSKKLHCDINGFITRVKEIAKSKPKININNNMDNML